MPLKQSVIEAFDVFDLSPNAEYAVAAKAYKKLAFLNHPDKCPGDHTATERFQKISAAWDICQRHYDNPSMSEAAMYDLDDDDDFDEDMQEYFMWMFSEMLYERFHSRGRRAYRRSRNRGPMFPSYMPPRSSYYEPTYEPFNRSSSSGTQSSTAYRSFSYSSNKNSGENDQAKAQDEFQKRCQELEKEIREEEAEKARITKEQQAAEDRIAQLYHSAFKAGREGDGQTLQELVKTHNLDVNRPEKVRKQKNTDSNKALQDPPNSFTSLLHVAAGACDVETVKFLKDRGASYSLLTSGNLSPFHVAISKGNADVVRHFLYLKPIPDNCHPSKALEDGKTPLQLALSSGNLEVVGLVLKDAPVHEVERCWATANEETRSVLITKRGFQPPDECDIPEEDRHLSKKAQKKRAQAREEERLREEKAAQQAKEKARADENQRKKEERIRRAKEREAREAGVEAAEQERQEAEARAQAQAEERRLTEIKAKEEAAARAQAEALAKAEAKARAKEKAHRQAEEAEARAKEKARRQAEEAASRKAEEEASAARAKAEAEAAATREAAKKKQEEERQERRRKAREDAKLKAKALKQEAADREQDTKRALEQETTVEVRSKPKKQGRGAKMEDTTKTSNQRGVCEYFKRGHCRNGDKCLFVHEQETLPVDPTPEPPSQKVCSFFAQGKRCRYGNKCRDAHVRSDVTPALPSEIPPPSIPSPPTPIPVEKPAAKKQDKPKPTPTPEQLRKRAEQSARDKARARAKLEAKRAQTSMPTPSPTPPPHEELPPPQTSTTKAPLLPSISPEGVHTRELPDDLFPLEAPDDTLRNRIIGLPSPQEHEPSQRSRGRSRGYPWWRRRGHKPAGEVVPP